MKMITRSNLCFILTITILNLASCKNESDSDQQNNAIDTNLTAEQHLQKVDSIYKSTENSLGNEDAYSNPLLNLTADNFISRLFKVSNINSAKEPKEVINSENIFSFGRTKDNDQTNVIVMNYTSEPVTYFIDQIDERKSTGMISQTTFKVHRRRIIHNGNGYKQEPFIILVQSNRGKRISIQVARIGEGVVYSYL